MTKQLEINAVYREMFRSEARFNIIYGSAGSGKSWALAQMVILSLLDNSVKRKWLICRKVGQTIRLSVWPQLIEIINDLGLHGRFKLNKSTWTIEAPNGSAVWCVGIDDVQKLKSILGVTDIWVEEASETLPSDFEELDTRIRGDRPEGYKKKIYLSFNPINKMHWLKSYFFDKKLDNSYILKTTYKDNAFLTQEDREALEKYKETNPYRYQVYALGEWGDIGSTIFSNFTVEDFDIDRIPGEMLWGVDFGFNHPSAIIGIKVYDDNVYICKELCKSGLTNTELIERAKLMRIDGTIMADSAEPDRIEEFRREDFDIRAVLKGPGSLNAGIDWLQSRKMIIHESCKNTHAEVSGYKWLEDKNGEPIDKPIPYNDDCLAAIRYAVEPVRLALGGVTAVESLWR